jgi:hypothetical protein
MDRHNLHPNFPVIWAGTAFMVGLALVGTLETTSEDARQTHQAQLERQVLECALSDGVTTDAEIHAAMDVCAARYHVTLKEELYP